MTTEERKKLWQDLVSCLILHGKIITITTSAKCSARKIERLVTLCKRAGEKRKLAYTKVIPFLKEPEARKLIEEIVPKLTTRNGGYTQIYKLHDYFTTHDKSIVMIVS